MDTTGLWGAVADDPYADPPRRAFADAIRAVDSDRAELIDLQLAVAPTPAQSKRVRALLRKNQSRWLGPLDPVAEPSSVVFERGFLEQIHLRAGGPGIEGWPELTTVAQLGCEVFGSPMLRRLKCAGTMRVPAVGDAFADWPGFIAPSWGAGLDERGLGQLGSRAVEELHLDVRKGLDVEAFRRLDLGRLRQIVVGPGLRTVDDVLDMIPTDAIESFGLHTRRMGKWVAGRVDVWARRVLERCPNVCRVELAIDLYAEWTATLLREPAGWRLDLATHDGRAAAKNLDLAKLDLDLLLAAAVPGNVTATTLRVRKPIADPDLAALVAHLSARGLSPTPMVVRKA